jgi:molybdopterin molybdotransferase
VMMRPGNPQTLGAISGVPFFGLPGNPPSTYVGFEIFVRPRCGSCRVLGDRPPRTSAHALARCEEEAGPPLLPARPLERASGGYEASLPYSQSSALLTAAHRGNCFVVLPEGEGFFAAGTQVECVRLDMEEGTP